MYKVHYVLVYVFSYLYFSCTKFKEIQIHVLSQMFKAIQQLSGRKYVLKNKYPPSTMMMSHLNPLN